METQRKDVKNLMYSRRLLMILMTEIMHRLLDSILPNFLMQTMQFYSDRVQNLSSAKHVAVDFGPPTVRVKKYEVRDA